MKYELRLRAKARDEFDRAFDWYENERVGLGRHFVERVDLVLERITRMPELNALVHRDIRRAVVGQFPYSVYYRIRGNYVIVIAVIHHSRDPKSWQSRR